MILEKITRGIITATYLTSIVGVGFGAMAVQGCKPMGETLLYINEAFMVLSGSLLMGSLELRNNPNYQDN
jgi:hypothetical protein